MRILFSFAGGLGHCDPLIPIARAAEAAGHTVAFTGRSSTIAAVAARGFTVMTTGAQGTETATMLPLLEPDPAREDRVLRDHYAGRLARERAGAVVELCSGWRPHLVVCDETDFGCMVAAERLGLPHATVLVIAAGSFVRPEVVAEPLQQVRASHGLPADPHLEMISRYLVLAPVPPSYRDPAFPLPATAHLVRPTAPEPQPPDDPPSWTAGLDAGPVVYATLGTVFNVESGDLFARILAGLAELGVNVVATVGTQIDPAAFGPQPRRVRIERYIPQAHVLPYCSLVVSHGGSGSVIGALAHGLPSVVLPMGADQPLNARRCAELGVSRVLDPVRARPAAVRDAVAEVTADPSYRRNAERLRDEIATLPGPHHAVSLLEALMV